MFSNCWHIDTPKGCGKRARREPEMGKQQDAAPETQKRETQRKRREDWSEWPTAKGRAEGWALLTHPQAAALTLLGDRIQAPGMCLLQSPY